MTFNEGKEPEVAYEEMKLAYEHGVNFFDNACAPTAPAAASESYPLTRDVLAARCTATATRRR